MKKTYQEPFAEKVVFNYSDQVSAATHSGCWATVEWYMENGICISDDDSKEITWVAPNDL